jgi:glycosyltransferase involved in cell wall biosynthesis
MSTQWHIYSDHQPRDPGSLEDALAAEHVFLTDLLPLPSTPSGFSARYASIIRRLCDLGTTTLHVALRKSNPALRHPVADIADEVSAVFPKLSHFLLTVHDPLAGHRLARRVHRIIFGSPRTSLPEVPSSYRIASRLVVTQPGLAHLGLDCSQSSTVYLLEEGFERRSKVLGHPVRSRLKYPVNVRSVRRLYRRISATGMPVVVLTEDERRFFSSWINPDNIHVVALSIDVSAFALPPAGERPEARYSFTVGVVGRLGDSRNQAPLRRLLSTAVAAGVSWRILLVGVGSETYASWQENSGHLTVDITGYVDQIEPWYRELDCALIPETEVTGSKTSVLQAWAAGVPCVVSEAAGRSCDVRDGEDVLVYADEPAALAALERVRVDAGLAETLARNGRQRVREQDLERSATRVVELLLGL